MFVFSLADYAWATDERALLETADSQRAALELVQLSAFVHARGVWLRMENPVRPTQQRSCKSTRSPRSGRANPSLCAKKNLMANPGYPTGHKCSPNRIFGVCQYAYRMPPNSGNLLLHKNKKEPDKSGRFQEFETTKTEPPCPAILGNLLMWVDYSVIADYEH